MKDADKLIITPKTKVLQLIETYPQLEDLLISYAPAFKKLKNPVLRRTVGKIATLQQAASIGNIKVEELINALRKEVGQDLFSEGEDNKYNIHEPGWFNKNSIAKVFNASEMLETGEQPVHQVVSDLKDLEKGDIYELYAPFLPAPLIDKATSLGFDHWMIKKSEEVYVVYFCKK